MFKILGIGALVLVLSISLVSVQAKSENSGQGSEISDKKTEIQSQKISDDNELDGDEDEVEDDDGDDKLLSGRRQGTASSGAKPVGTCAPEAQWKNHGDYVSCVAHLKQGGKAVSEAARSSIGKKNATPSASFLPSPSSTASASPIASESAEPSPTTEATSAGVLTQVVQDTVQGLIISIQTLLSQIQDLLSF